MGFLRTLVWGGELNYIAFFTTSTPAGRIRLGCGLILCVFSFFSCEFKHFLGYGMVWLLKWTLFEHDPSVNVAYWLMLIVACVTP